MYGNGVAIGIVAVIIQARHKPILQVPIVGRTACTVAVAGPATIGTVAFRIVTATTRRTASTTSASGLRSKVNFSFQKATSFHAFHYNFQFEALHGVCFHPSRKAVSEGRSPPSRRDESKLLPNNLRMQFKIFTTPLIGSEEAQEKLWCFHR